jgi:3-oxoacyl-[acyl-carrier protein] reductase
MDFALSGRVALITGGGRGIGRTVALTLADHGVDIALCGRTPATLASTAEEIRARGVRAFPIQADVAELANIEHFVSEAHRQAGRIDILVNNAVSSLYAPFDEQTDDHWRHHLDVKLMAYIRSAREVMPYMKEQRWGRIVNIGGMTARIVAPLRITNGVVNAGVTNFTKQLANQVAPFNVTVNCVHPGATQTDRQTASLQRRATDAGISIDDMTQRAIADIPLGRLIQPQDIANAVLFYCSPLAEVITGQAIAVDGGTAMSVNY